MVAGRGVLLLEAPFVLLIDDDQPQPAEGEEDGGAHAEYQVVGVVGELLLPDFDPLGVGEFAVIDAELGAEDALQALRDLRGEGYLGQEVEHLSALAELLGDEVHVDLRLAGGGDAVQQTDVAGGGVAAGDAAEGGAYLVEGALLRLAERTERHDGLRGGYPEPPHLLEVLLQHPALDEPVIDGHPCPAACQQFLPAHLSRLGRT